MSDPFAEALHDFQLGEQRGTLRYRNGTTTEDADVGLYFDEFDPESGSFLDTWLDGPLLDLGAGAGRHALYFQMALRKLR